jgi:hypothetical protein
MDRAIADNPGISFQQFSMSPNDFAKMWRASLFFALEKKLQIGCRLSVC